MKYIIKLIEGFELSGYGVKRVFRVYTPTGIQGKTMRGTFTVKEIGDFQKLYPDLQVPDINLFISMSESDFEGNPSQLPRGTYWMAMTFPWIQPPPEIGHHYVYESTKDGWVTRQIQDEEKASLIVIAK